MSGGLILTASMLYLLALFGVARLGERWQERWTRSPSLRAIVYGLALGVYCTTWTVYGAVGTAAREGYAYLPIYLGPILLMLLFAGFYERLARLARHHGVASIADFLSARYGRSPALAAMVTVTALGAVLPYLALQFQAIAGALRVFGVDAVLPVLGTMAVVTTILTIHYGASRTSAAEQRAGLLLVLAVESLVKIVVLLLIAGYAWFLAPSAPADWHRELTSAPVAPGALLVQTGLAAAAMLALPRMFHVGIVECLDPADIRRGRWVLIAYLLLVTLAILPLLSAARSLGADVDPDRYLLWLPIGMGQGWLALLGLIAGLSAASAMMIAALMALSTMLSNDLILPVLIRRGVKPSSHLLLNVRRGAMLTIAALSFAWFAFGIGAGSLAQIGMVAFAAAAQFTPGLIAGFFSTRIGPRPVIEGLAVGTLLWFVLLFLPLVTGSGAGRSTALLANLALVATLANAVTLLLGSLRMPLGLSPRLAARRFLAAEVGGPGESVSGVRAEDLQTLLVQVLGAEEARRLMAARRLDRSGAVDAEFLKQVERVLAGAIGSASARALLTRALSGRDMPVEELLQLLDESSSRRRQSQQLLAATFEHMSQAVSVVDREMRLSTWNQRYAELLGLDPGLLREGTPIAELMRAYDRSIGRDEAESEQRIERRLKDMRGGERHSSIRQLGDGRTVAVRGEPLPDGGYVTTFADITEALALTRERDLAQLRAEELERLNREKNAFVAAASHDLLQPLSAARLYLSSAREADAPTESRSLLARVDHALTAAEDLLVGLTDLARLEQGRLQPEQKPIDVAQLFEGLRSQFAQLADSRGLALRFRPCRLAVHSDPRLLRRILQNFIANALRYTASGRVLVAARCRGTTVELQVWDTGPGIPESRQALIFSDQPNVGGSSPWGERGLGIGLSGCRRMADALGHPLGLRSRPGRGSCFSVGVPRSSAISAESSASTEASASTPAGRVLLIDNDPAVLDGFRLLLTRWGHRVESGSSIDDALKLLTRGPYSLALIDFSLDHRGNGLQIIAALRQRDPGLPCVLVTADRDPDLPSRARAIGALMAAKPLKPAALRALLRQQRSVSSADGGDASVQPT